jgi:magnesium transporter
MLTAYLVNNQTLQKKHVNQFSELTPDIRWLDLNNPTEQERQWVKQAYAQDLLFIEELGEIEASARFYSDEHGLHLHLYFLHVANSIARNINVGFTINQGRLFTLHAEDVPEMRAYNMHAGSHPDQPDDALSIMLGIAQTRIGMLADTYEKLQTELEDLSLSIFGGNERSITRVLQELARLEDLNGKARLGLLGNRRVFQSMLRGNHAPSHVEPINENLQDNESLMTHATFLSERAKFLMDSAMGMINIAHSRRLGIFTVLSVVLMPPMLIASIYGMNFEHMPELKWLWGYPAILALMLAAAAGPILYLRSRKWL